MGWLHLVAVITLFIYIIKFKTGQLWVIILAVCHTSSWPPILSLVFHISITSHQMNKIAFEIFWTDVSGIVRSCIYLYIYKKLTDILITTPKIKE